MPTSESFPIFGDWGELWIPHLARRSLIECYSMLQNSRVTAFTVFELLRENQLVCVCVGGGGGGGCMCSRKKIDIIFILCFQFDDAGTDKLTGISTLCSNELYAMTNASSSPNGKGSAWT